MYRVYARHPGLFYTLIQPSLAHILPHSFWMVGSIYAAVAAWIILGDNNAGERILPGGTWRIFVVIAALPVFFTLGLAIFLLTESPRYLTNKGKYHEAAKTLQR